MGRHSLPRTVFILVFMSLVILLNSRSVPAQGGTEPRTIHNACVGNCVAEVNFLHSGMGDTQARYAYNAWFDTYYTLTGCEDPAWKTDLLFLLDIIGDAVGAPGAPTMQCWQGLAAQASLCSSDCSNYSIRDARYAPNVKLILDQGSPGYLEVTADNESNLGKLPELQPNAYSRRFSLKTYLAYEGGEALLVNETPMPSLSFPNWITRGGLDVCIDEYGFESARCQILANFALPSVASTSVEFLDGAFYDLSGQVSDLSDASGSFSTDGYIRLLSDGDSITIAQGPYAGYTLVKTHYLSSDQHTVSLQEWDASNGPVTITNHECVSWLSTCWISETRRESDTYVFALRGPQDRVLEGTYTVQVVADIPHDKDFRDNRVSYSYDVAAATQGTTGTGGGTPATPTPTISVSDLHIVNLPGPGYHSASYDQGPGMMFRLNVLDEVSFMLVRLVSEDGGQYDAFIRRGSIPVPDYPYIGDDYECWATGSAGYSGSCSFSDPAPGDYYIFVHSWHASGGIGRFRLEILWTIPTPVLAATPTPTPTATVTPTPTEVDDSVTLTEVEPNGNYEGANSWDMQGPFTGEMAFSMDVDVLWLTFSQSGIYTFSLTDVGPGLRLRMVLTHPTTHHALDSATAPTAGQPVYFTFDASAGEQYYLLILPVAFASGAEHQRYTLSFANFIPDPDEPNDNPATATEWDLRPVSGYFWDKASGPHDYFTFLAPATLGGEPITFTLTNPDLDLRVRLTLLDNNGTIISYTSYSAAGQPVTLARTLTPGQRYYLRPGTMYNHTSLLPYILSAVYTPAAAASPTVAPTAFLTATPVPPRPTAPPRPTSPPLPTATPLLPTATPTPDQPVTVISGHVWRLSPASGPAGLGGVSVFLAVNGAEQSAVLSQIDGSYRIEMAGVQPGDRLGLRAASAGNVFEPAAYQWQAEAGINRWRYDFYTYQGTITPPAGEDQNRLYGYVRDAAGNGVAGVRVLVQMGTSDALQVLGPTDASGYYEGFVWVPSRIMVSVWTETPGYLPSRAQFFHTFAPENREINFTQPLTPTPAHGQR